MELPKMSDEWKQKALHNYTSRQGDRANHERKRMMQNVYNGFTG